MRGSFISKSIYVIFHFKDVVVVLKLEGPNHNGPLSPQKNGGPQVYFYRDPPGPLGDYTPAKCCEMRSKRPSIEIIIVVIKGITYMDNHEDL